MAFKSNLSFRLVKSEDLNHHGTLFAGRCAEWFVESGFVAVAAFLSTKHIVFLKINGMEFLYPIHAGDVLAFDSRVVRAGRTSLSVYVKVYEQKKASDIFSEGFITFCHVDDETRPTPHNISLTAKTPEEINLQQEAKNLLAYISKPK